jgi:hypothetical protein
MRFSIRIPAGTRAWKSERASEAIVRNIIDMTKTVEKEMSRKKKKGPGSLLKLVMK